jgi:hypothetical protein
LGTLDNRDGCGITEEVFDGIRFDNDEHVSDALLGFRAVLQKGFRLLMCCTNYNEADFRVVHVRKC